MDGVQKLAHIAQCGTAHAAVPLTSGLYFGSSDKRIRELLKKGQLTTEGFIKLSAAPDKVASGMAIHIPHLIASLFVVLRIRVRLHLPLVRLYLPVIYTRAVAYLQATEATVTTLMLTTTHASAPPC